MAHAGSDSSSDLRFEFTSPQKQLNGRNGLKIEIRFGDIFESTADAIVVPEGTSFKHKGFVARHLTQIEPKYEKIRKTLVGKNGSFTPWEVYTEKLGKKFQHVVCAIVPACDRDVEEWKQKFKLLYQRIFREADRKVISVLAVPLIGSGRGGASQEDAIEMAIASALKFKGSSMTKILFVSNDENTVALMASACRHTCGIKPQSVTQARPQSSTHRSQSTRPSSSIPKHRKENPKNGTNDCSSQARPGHTNVRSSLNSMLPLEIDGKDFTPRGEVIGSKEGEKRIRVKDKGVGDERNRSRGDHCSYSPRFEEIKERNRRGRNIPLAEATAYQQSFDAFHETGEEFEGTTRDQERQIGKIKHRSRDKISELTRINNALGDVGRYEEETYRNDVRMMDQMDKRSDVSRKTHIALADDREGNVTGLQQEKIKNRLDNDGYDKYESNHLDVFIDGRHRSKDKYSQERKLYGNSDMDANRSDVMQGNGEVLVDRSVKTTGETFNLQATRNKGQQISGDGVFGMGGQNYQHGGMITSEAEMKHQISGVAESSLKESKMEAVYSKLEHRGYGYQSNNKGTINKQETTVSSSAAHGVYRDPATDANECLDNLKKEAEKRNLVIRENEAIGDCMFISLSQQLEHVLNQHIRFLEIRRQLVKYLRDNPTLQIRSKPSDFLVNETWEQYLDRMGRRRQWGDHIMLIAAANVYQVEIVVIRSTGQETSIEPNIPHGIVPQLFLGLVSEKHYISLEKDGVKVPFPPSWTRMSSNSELFTVSSGCQEYQDVSRRFLSSIGTGQHRTIVEIKRVQSKTLWQLYCAKKQDIDSQDPCVQSERVLWHGTKKNSVLPISIKGFNRGFSGQNAAQYGDGVYFAPDSSYAAEDTYSVPDDNGHKYVFQARVLTGTYTKGEKGMRVPPWRNQEQHLTYDSVVDNVAKPNLYVIFHDAQAYPEYLVTFT